MDTKKYIYLDYAANTPVDTDVLKVFNETTLKYFANPNSTHELGKKQRKRLKNMEYVFLLNLHEL